jgi:probable HAF family extracellular repeat protein
MHTRMHRVGTRISRAAAMAALCVTMTVLHAQTYTVKVLDTTLPDTFSAYATSINKHGQIAGRWLDSEQVTSGAISWTPDGTPMLLSFTYANGINAAGHMVGDICPDYPDGCVPIFWNGRIVKDLPPSSFTGPTVPLAINDAGEIVGYSFSISPEIATTFALLWRGGKVTQLETLGGDESDAEAINQAGDIAGGGLTPDNADHAILWRHLKAIDLGLGPLGGAGGALGLNDTGWVVGASSDPSFSINHATLWVGKRAIDLGTLPGGNQSSANGVNNHGEIVGSAQASDGTGHGVLWRCSKIIDLQTIAAGTIGSIYTLNAAVAINDDGWIAANAAGRDGSNLAVLFTPKHNPGEDHDEPHRCRNAADR